MNKLVLSEEAFFFERSLDLLSVISMDGYFKRINPMFTETLGYSEAELLASSFLNFVHPDDHSATLAEMEKWNTGIPTINFNNRYRTKDGCYRCLAWTGAPQIDRGVMYCVARDITEQKKTQAALQESEERLKLALEGSKDGTYKWILDRGQAIRNEAGDVLRMVSSHSNVTERRELEAALQRANFELEQRVAERTAQLEQVNAALQENEDRLRLAIAPAQLGTWDWNLVTGELKWDTGCKAMFGLPPDAEISIEVFFEGIHPDERDRLKEIVQEALNFASSAFCDAEYRTIGIEDKVERWLRTKGQAYYDATGKPLRFIGTVLNITEQKLAEAQLIHDVFHDSLTGLPNRALFIERVEGALVLTKRHSDYRFAVLFLDVDRFKVINDSLGHAIGDQLLTALARRLERCVRAGDTVARLGGDEPIEWVSNPTGTGRTLVLRLPDCEATVELEQIWKQNPLPTPIFLRQLVGSSEVKDECAIAKEEFYDNLEVQSLIVSLQGQIADVKYDIERYSQPKDATEAMMLRILTND
ncbi:PAS domain-containing protein [Scytonema sp. UIC 10036]|uniref:PAS domain-containing protein n=1 Tax=Scytonema sp. UIC 10036 TaxID=2304196 RepID=UPI0012DA6C76|nr:PAS domain-containing protein [Scytonema sp. UIC 10036]MUG97411.1 PAS domain-containing protein [Scytonema sp. UIC 10036]